MNINLNANGHTFERVIKIRILNKFEVKKIFTLLTCNIVISLSLYVFVAFFFFAHSFIM